LTFKLDRTAGFDPKRQLIPIASQELVFDDAIFVIGKAKEIEGNIEIEHKAKRKKTLAQKSILGI